VATNATPIERKAWIALAITSLALYMNVLDASAVNVAFPSVQRDLETSRSTLSWLLSSYTISTASFLLLAGHLGDRIGRKKVFTWALLIFIVGSAIAGIAQSFEMLILGRVVQGVGAAGVAPTSLALCLPLFPPERRSTAIGVWGSMASAGAATGPTVGALLIDVASWRAIFWVNIPIGFAVIGLAILNVPESEHDRVDRGKVDPFGVPILTLGVALVMLAIVQSGSWGLLDTRIVILVVAGATLLPLAIWRSQRHPNPALDLSLFRVRSYWTSILVIALFGCGFLAGFLSTTLYIQDLWGYSVVETGLALSPGPVLATIVGVFSGRIAERVGHRIPVFLGITAMAGSYLFLYATASTEPYYLGRFLPATLLLGVGLGLSLANLTGMALSEMTSARFAIANATARTVQQMANSFGIAVVVTLLGSGFISVANYRRGWFWVIVMFAGGAVATLTLFPRRKPGVETARPS